MLEARIRVITATARQPIERMQRPGAVRMAGMDFVFRMTLSFAMGAVRWTAALSAMAQEIFADVPNAALPSLDGGSN